MNIITRKEAKALGLDKYYTGQSCKHGHISERYMSTRTCIECNDIHNEKWYKENIEEHRKHNTRWRIKNPEYKKTWNQINSYKCNALTAKSAASKLQRTPPWVDYQKIEPFYVDAQYLTKETGIKYDVDHIIPLRGKYVSGLHIEINLQVITHIANVIKGNRFDI